MKTEIIEKLKELHKEQGIVFTTEEDAMGYYKRLVELIESFFPKWGECPIHNMRWTGTVMCPTCQEELEKAKNQAGEREMNRKEVNFDGVLLGVLLDLVKAINNGHCDEQWASSMREKIYDLPQINRIINDRPQKK